MNDPSLPPPAALRRARIRLRRDRRRLLAPGAATAAGAWALVAVLAIDAGTEPAVWSATSLVAAAASAASLTVVVSLWVGHVVEAGRRWPSHFARLPRLVIAILGGTGSWVGPAVGAVVGGVAALVVAPAVALGPAAAAVGLTITPVGYALVFAWHTAAVARATVSGTGETWALTTRRAALLAGGLVAGAVSVARAFLLEGGCAGAWLLSVDCGTPPWLAALGAAVGALFAFPLFAVYGMLVSLTLDGVPLGELAGPDDA